MLRHVVFLQTKALFGMAKLPLVSSFCELIDYRITLDLTAIEDLK